MMSNPSANARKLDVNAPGRVAARANLTHFFENQIVVVSGLEGLSQPTQMYDTQAGVQSDETQANWRDDSLTKALIKVYAEFLRNSSRTSTTQKKLSASECLQITNAFYAATSQRYNQTQLKNRVDTLKTIWNIWERLLHGETGLGWDAKKGTTVKMPEEWWARKLREVPKAARFKNKGPLLPDEQHFIFHGSLAIGEQAWTSGTGQWPEGLDDEDSGNGDEIGREGEGEAEQPTFEDIGRHEELIHNGKDVPPGYKPKKHKVSARDNLSSSIDDMVSFWKTKSAASSAPNPTDDVDACLSLLDKLPDMSYVSEVYRYAIGVFTKPEYRRVFLKLPKDTTHKQFVEDALKYYWNS